MAKRRVVCPKCKVSIMADESLASLRCPKCGEFIRLEEKRKVEATAPQSAVISSRATLEAKLSYAEGLLEVGNYSRAEKAFRNAAALYPEDYRCHWGIVRSITKNFTDYYCPDCTIDFANAVRYAGEVSRHSMSERYKQYNEERRMSESERLAERMKSTQSGTIIRRQEIRPAEQTTRAIEPSANEAAKQIVPFVEEPQPEEKAIVVPPPQPQPEPDPQPEPQPTQQTQQPQRGRGREMTEAERRQLREYIKRVTDDREKSRARLRQKEERLEVCQQKDDGEGAFCVKPEYPVRDTIYFVFSVLVSVVWLMLLLNADNTLVKVLIWIAMVLSWIFVLGTFISLMMEFRFNKVHGERYYKEMERREEECAQLQKDIAEAENEIAQCDRIIEEQSRRLREGKV